MTGDTTLAQGSEAEALALDRADPLPSLRAEFSVPPWAGARYQPPD